MKRRRLVIAPFATAAVVTAGCSTPAAPSPPPVRMAAGHWDDFNRAQIGDLIATLGRSSPAYDPARRP